MGQKQSERKLKKLTIILSVWNFQSKSSDKGKMYFRHEINKSKKNWAKRRTKGQRYFYVCSAAASKKKITVKSRTIETSLRSEVNNEPVGTFLDTWKLITIIRLLPAQKTKKSTSLTMCTSLKKWTLHPSRHFALVSSEKGPHQHK